MGSRVCFMKGAGIAWGILHECKKGLIRKYAHSGGIHHLPGYGSPQQELF